MVSDQLKSRTVILEKKEVCIDVDYIEIKNTSIYVAYNDNGPICYMYSEEDAKQYKLKSKSKSPVRIKKIELK